MKAVINGAAYRWTQITNQAGKVIAAELYCGYDVPMNIRRACAGKQLVPCEIDGQKFRGRVTWWDTDGHFIINRVEGL